MLLAATETLSAVGRPLLHAGALADAGLALVGRGANDAGIELLNAAFDAYQACGATAEMRRISRVLQPLGVVRRVVRQRHQSGWSSLTESERRVVDFVIAGSTSREVALALNVSPNTVNTHLRKAFTKLEVHSRAELIALAEGKTS